MELTIEQALQQGTAAHKEGKLQEAERLYRSILQSQSTHPDANHNLGLLAIKAGTIEKSLPFFKVALEINPTINKFWQSYINALISSNKVSEAERLISMATRKGVNSKMLMKLRAKVNNSKTALNERVAIKNPPEQHLLELIKLYSNGEYQELLVLAESLTKKFSNSSILFNILGAANAALKRFDIAIEKYQKAITLDSKNAEPHNNIGVGQ